MRESSSAPLPLPLPLPNEFPPVSRLVPHRGTMLLIDNLVENGPRESRVATLLKSGAPYMRAGVLDGHWSIEIMAQSVAARIGYAFFLQGKPLPLGYLVAIDEFNYSLSKPLVVGDKVEVVVHPEYESSSVGAYSTELCCYGEVYVQARMKFVADEERREWEMDE